MGQSEAYHLSIAPRYLPSRDAPETMSGQVSFHSAGNERVVCRIEVQAEWEGGGTVETSNPDPPTLPGLTTGEIKERARRFAGQFRDDRLAARPDPDAGDRERESSQASAG